MPRNERGAALPVVLAVSTLMFILLTVTVSMTIRGKQAERLWWERLRAGYAAESGMALMQERLRTDPSRVDADLVQIDEFLVEVEIVKRTQRELLIRATAHGSRGVRRTAEAEADPETLVIRRRIR